MFYPLICFTGAALFYLTLGAYGASRTRTHQNCPNCRSRNHVWRAYYLNPRSGRKVRAEYDAFYGLWLAGGLSLIAAGFLIDILLIFDGLPTETLLLILVLLPVEIFLIYAAVVRLLLVLRARGKQLTGEFKCLECGEQWVILPEQPNDSRMNSRTPA
ncbi:MAG: hypothetical protein M5U05_14520 [Anaerolineales bacterium]|jgi:DNA-directed RNA polymerase subunit RPC12/RpoP|nr:hypothetical protein [Anaerolineales bacterium]